MFTYRPEINYITVEKSEEESEASVTEITSKLEEKSSKTEQEIKLLERKVKILKRQLSNASIDKIEEDQKEEITVEITAEKVPQVWTPPPGWTMVMCRRGCGKEAVSNCRRGHCGACCMCSPMEKWLTMTGS